MISIEGVKAAAAALDGVARKTDLIEGHERGAGKGVYLKTENLQATGSFKLRGAYYKISTLTDEEKQAGIIACSAGNHAQGVALAAGKMGIPCVICMPDGAPISKVEATRALGAEVILVPGSYDDAYHYASQIQEKTGATLIHPFDDERVIEGQATIGLEILEQLPDVDTIVVPVGGGGLIAGLAFAAKSINPDIKVYGVQAQNAPCVYERLRNADAAPLGSVATFADGIAVKVPGEITLDLIREYVDEVVTVSDDEIATAVLSLMEKEKLISEGAGATSVAAVLFDKLPLSATSSGDTKTVCVVSGGNIDVNILSRVITRGLVTSGRSATLHIALEDKPGQLSKVSNIISDCGGNVVQVYHSGSDPAMAITSCNLTVGLETRDHDHVQEIKDALRHAGLQLVNSPGAN